MATDATGLDNAYLLKRATLERDAGHITEAIQYYQKYINSHPTTTGLRNPAYHDKAQYYISKLLRAYSNLLRLYKSRDHRKAITWMRQLYQTYDKNAFCLKNRYNIAEIFCEHKSTGKAEKILTEIIDTQQSAYDPGNIKVTLRAFKKLFDIYDRLDESEKRAALAEKLHTLQTRDFDIKDQYQLANAHIENGNETRGLQILCKIVASQAGANETNFHTLLRTYKQLAAHNVHDPAKALLEKIKQTYHHPQCHGRAENAPKPPV
ncbi:MAG: tetratricopeptide repeat protein [Thermodesulfobacteriota bacterium]|nr:tetratricopeptide repeat protein [Thermodesulfobacteriota bacterium]